MNEAKRSELSVPHGWPSEDCRILAFALSEMQRAMKLRTKREADEVLTVASVRIQTHYLSK